MLPKIYKKRQREIKKNYFQMPLAEIESSHSKNDSVNRLFPLGKIDSKRISLLQ